MRGEILGAKILKAEGKIIDHAVVDSKENRSTAEAPGEKEESIVPEGKKK